MSVQIRGRQIMDNTITAAKLVLSGDFDFTSGTVSVASPSSANHAASKSYVDSAIQGVTWKEAVRVRSTSNVSVSSAPAAIDGVTMAADDRVLLVAQSSGAEDGIYVYNGSGSAMTRASDADPYTELDGAAVFVKEGTSADEGFVQTASLSGYDDQVWVQFSGAGNITAGDGLAKSGNTLSVNVDGSSIEISSDALRIKASGVSNAMLANSAVSIAGQSISLGGSITADTIAGQISSGTITNAQLSGSIANGKLANSSITIAGAATALGGSISAASILGASNTDSLSEGSSNLYYTDARARAAISVADTSELDLSYSGGQISGALIAGSVANSKLTNSSVSFGGVSVALGSSDATPAFDLQHATGYPTSSLVGTVTNAQLAGSINANKLMLNDVNFEAIPSGGNAGQLALKLGSIANDLLAADTIATAKLGYQGYYESFSANGSVAGFDLARAIKANLAQSFVVTVNGLVMDYKASPDAKDNFKIDNTGASSVGKITFGANLDNGDKVAIRYVA